MCPWWLLVKYSNGGSCYPPREGHRDVPSCSELLPTSLVGITFPFYSLKRTPFLFRTSIYRSRPTSFQFVFSRLMEHDHEVFAFDIILVVRSSLRNIRCRNVIVVGRVFIPVRKLSRWKPASWNSSRVRLSTTGIMRIIAR